MPDIENAVSPFEEMVAYETLLAQQGETLKSVSRQLSKEHLLPSELLERMRISASFLKKVAAYLRSKEGFSVLVDGAFQYPDRLKDAEDPVSVLYAKGDLGLLESPCISIVGARAATDEGRRRAAKLAKELVEAKFTIVSGLAAGIDTVALNTAIKCGGLVVGVVGTPIDEYYPKKNEDLQNEIARNYLLISQVPFYRYEHQPFPTRRFYFPMRNETMAALSQATVIVEASDKSGTLSQARACFQQGRKLFILESCFQRKDITWPAYYEKKGAVRVRETEDVLRALSSGPDGSKTGGENASTLD
jgi:DNA processing protein